MAMIRNCFAARGFGPHKSILFLFSVTVDQDADTGLFEASIDGLEHSIGSTAGTDDQATHHVMRCFTCLVDDAIERRIRLRDVLPSDAVKVIPTQLPLNDVVKMMLAVGNDTEPERDEWRLTDMSPMFSQLEAVAV